MSKNNNSSSHTVEAALSQIKSAKNQGPTRSKDEIALATSMVLLEIASSDQVVDKFERVVILNGLKGLYKLSDEAANGLLSRAKAQLSSMRGSSASAELLRDALDSATKRALAQVIDNLIRCNGVVDGMEIYLRKRFRTILGIPDEVMGHFE